MAESCQSEFNLTVWPATQMRRRRAMDRGAGYVTQTIAGIIID